MTGYSTSNSTGPSKPDMGYITACGRQEVCQEVEAGFYEGRQGITLSSATGKLGTNEAALFLRPVDRPENVFSPLTMA